MEKSFRILRVLSDLRLINLMSCFYFLFLLFLSLCFAPHNVEGYLPIFFFHGITNNGHQFDNMINIILKAHPDTPVFPLFMFQGPNSYAPLWLQVEYMASNITNIIKQNPTVFNETTQYNFICHSQGALLCRCVSMYMDNHNVHTLLSLAGPQMGVYDVNYFNFEKNEVLENITLNEIYLLAYSPLIQNTLSIGNLWHDPKQESAFIKQNIFLPIFNGLLINNNTEKYKNNFIRLNKAIFTVGTFDNSHNYDGGIGPWDSGIWGYFDETGKNKLSMKDFSFYQNDTFGLRTLDQSGRLLLVAEPNVEHEQWVDSPELINKYIIPNLF